MLSPVVDHVTQRVARAPRRGDHFQMIAVCEHRASTATVLVTAEYRVDVPRDRDLESLEPAREGFLVCRLDQQVHMVALQAEMDDPDALTDRGDDRGLAHCV